MDYNKFLKIWDSEVKSWGLIPIRTISGIYYKPDGAEIVIAANGYNTSFKYTTTKEAQSVFDNICNCLEAWDTYL